MENEYKMMENVKTNKNLKCVNLNLINCVIEIDKLDIGFGINWILVLGFFFFF
jgi:hypothetical protein